MDKKFKWLIAILVIVCLHSEKGNSQSIIRQSINSYSPSGYIPGGYVSQTIGQPYSTFSYKDVEIGINPGFQQAFMMNLKVSKKVEPIEELTKFKIYPNPASSFLHLEFNDVVENACIKVTNMKGKTFLIEKLSDVKEYQINCKSWKEGIYVVSVLNAENSANHSSKILISK
mgnify:CR=1 FL=1